MLNYDALTKTQLYDAVLQETTELLNTVLPNTVMTTNDIVEALYPKAKAIYATQEATRNLVYKAIAWYATRHLKAYCTRGEPRLGKGKYKDIHIRPFNWHAHKELVVCNECGQEYFK